MKGLRLTWILLAMLFLQQLPWVAAWGVDLPLIFTVLVGLRSEATPASAWGFLCGSLQDLLSAGGWGPNTVPKTLIGLLSWSAQRHVFRERVSTQTAWILVSSVLHQGMIWGILNLRDAAPDGGNAFGIAARNIAATTLVGALVCWVVVKSRRRRMDPATA